MNAVYMDQKHSELGIASFGICIVIIIVLILLNYVANSIKEQVIASLFSLFMSLVALGLGIVGLGQKDRMKLFTILGTILSAVVLIFNGCVFLIFNMLLTGSV
jgi:hypothetical protein